MKYFCSDSFTSKKHSIDTLREEIKRVANENFDSKIKINQG